jgi:type IV pilus assembly protein PilW
MRLVQRGFSLIELMVSLTLALLLIAAAGTHYIASKKAFVQNNGMAQVQDSLRASLLMIGTAVRQAGFLPDPRNQTAPTQYFRNAGTGSNTLAVFGNTYGDSKGSNLVSDFPFAKLSGASYPGGLHGLTAGYLAVSFAGVGDKSAASSAQMRDCVGTPVYADEIAVNVFFVARLAKDHVYSLYCAARHYDSATLAVETNDDQVQPLIQGVGFLGVRYGLAANGSHQPVQYLTAAEMTATAWPQVTSVQVTIVATSQDGIAIGTTANVDAGTHVNHIAGGYLQQELTQTIAVRNRLQ